MDSKTTGAEKLFITESMYIMMIMTSSTPSFFLFCVWGKQTCCIIYVSCMITHIKGGVVGEPVLFLYHSVNYIILYLLLVLEIALFTGIVR